MVYCGSKNIVPRGKIRATQEVQCVRQIRAFGRQVVRSDQAKATLAQWGSGKGCGKRNPSSVQGNCTRQFRLFGLLPIIESASDVHRRTFVAKTKTEHRQLPQVIITPPHAYTQNKYEGNIPSGATTVFCSVIWSQAEDGAALRPQTIPDGVGFAFGYFSPRLEKEKTITFNIVHVYANPPYRGGKLHAQGVSISSLVVSEFVKGITYRAKEVNREARNVRIQVDPGAPCFQLGNPQYMNAKRSKALENMYVGAGFSVIPLPYEGRQRRKVELITRVNDNNP
jgi:hypothetical protein|tara:strand:+ start:157 stop:1002 length:846 start_codon:yes stop_codon:yes gene_type:complete